MDIKGMVDEFIGTLNEFVENDIKISILDCCGRQLYSTNYQSMDYTSFEQYKNKAISGIPYIFKNNNSDVALTMIEISDKPGFFIWIEGPKRDIKQLSVVLKMVIEIRLKYEEERIKEQKEKNINERLISYLIETSNINVSELNHLLKMTTYQPALKRTMCVFLIPEDIPIDLINNSNFYFDSYQDIVAVYKRYLVVLKDCSLIKYGTVQEFMDYITEFINFVTKNSIVNTTAYITDMCTDFKSFYQNFKYTLWMIENESFIDKSKNIVFFKDVIDVYFMSQIPFEVFQIMYDKQVKNFNFDKKEFIEIISSLENCNYNVTKASKELYMHRNTFLYKFEKIKLMLNVDPLNYKGDRAYLKNLGYYFQVMEMKGILK